MALTSNLRFHLREGQLGEKEQTYAGYVDRAEADLAAQRQRESFAEVRRENHLHGADPMVEVRQLEGLQYEQGENPEDGEPSSRWCVVLIY